MERGPSVVHCGDVVDVLPTLEAESFDAVLCDPPYGLKFMGKAWDHGVPGEPIWREVLRVLKPGAHLLAFGGTRTFHRLTCAIEDSGFEIRDCLSWLYGSGFPKSLDISKEIDKKAGHWRARAGAVKIASQPSNGMEYERTEKGAPITAAAATWSGYGTALKPAWEPCVVAMKPCDGTFAENALRNGVAGINVDGCRVGNETTTTHSRGATTAFAKRPGEKSAEESGRRIHQNRPEFVGVGHAGRWPANLILNHHPDCVEIEQTITRGYDQATRETTMKVEPSRWECHEDCAVRMLDAQSGERRSAYPGRQDLADAYHGTKVESDGVVGFGGSIAGLSRSDSGGASRFFYTAKASRSEREAGLREAGLPEAGSGAYGEFEGDGRGRQTEHRPARNYHPTVKPLALCEYLARLILPPKRDTPRRLLVPFSGSGSEMIGALLAGWDEVVGIEKEAEYVTISEARLRYWTEREGEQMAIEA